MVVANKFAATVITNPCSLNFLSSFILIDGCRQQVCRNCHNKDRNTSYQNLDHVQAQPDEGFLTDRWDSMFTSQDRPLLPQNEALQIQGEIIWCTILHTIGSRNPLYRDPRVRV